MDGLQAAAKHGVRFSAHSVGGMFGLYFAPRRRQLRRRDGLRQGQPSTASSTPCWTPGMYFAPSAFEAGFVSAAHSEADIDSTIAAADAAFARL
jgi:glutamate-1-semialdehyde 2,1-aminomutase